MNHHQQALDLTLKTSQDFGTAGNTLLIQTAQVHALLAIADAITTKTPPTQPADTPTNPGWRTHLTTGIGDQMQPVTCACGSQNWAKYPLVRPISVRDWWVCGNITCFRVADLSAGSPVYVHNPVSGLV